MSMLRRTTPARSRAAAVPSPPLPNQRTGQAVCGLAAQARGISAAVTVLYVTGSCDGQVES